MIDKIVHIILGVSLVISFSNATANIYDQGKILYVSFAGNNSNTVRPGIAQFEINGGFSQENCDARYAGISSDDSHLISLLLTAQSQEKEVEVYLDNQNKYYSDRCTVKYLVLRS